MVVSFKDDGRTEAHLIRIDTFDDRNPQSIHRRTLLGSFNSPRASNLFNVTLAFLEAGFVHITDPRRSEVILVDDIGKSIEPWHDI
jgi:hypothetical protein